MKKVRIMSIDFGRKHTGVAFARSFLAEPYCVLHSETTDELVKKIKKCVDELKPDTILIGTPDNGPTVSGVNLLAQELRNISTAKVKLVDEDMSSFDARSLSIEANIGKKRRKSQEDSFAAAVILQNYLDTLLE